MSGELAIRRDDLQLLSQAREVFGDALTLVILTGRTVAEEDSAPTRSMELKLDLASGTLADRQNASSLGTAVDIADELLKV